MPEDTNCSVYAEDVLRELYGDRVLRYRKQIRIYQGEDRWAPVHAVVALGGREVESPIPGEIHLMQGWGPDGGHTSFWWEPPAVQDAVGVQAQANAALGSFIEDDQTFEQQKGRYAEVRLAVLPTP